MGVDFLTGMTLFIITLFFVFQMLFGMIEPYTSTSTEHVATADRVSERIVSDVWTDDDANQRVVNYTKMMRFFERPDDEIENIVGAPIATTVNVTLTADHYNYPPAGDDLVGHWAFNRRLGATVFDSAALPQTEGLNHGTVIGRVTRGTHGVMSSPAIRFHGGGEYVRIPESPSYEVAKTENVSVSLWVKPRVTGGSDIPLFERYDTDESQQVWGVFLDGGLRPAVNFNDTVTVPHPDAVSAGEWHHIVAVYNGSATNQVKLYLNGDPQAASSSINFEDDGNASMVVANTTIGLGGADLNGSLDELRIYDEALGEPEVRTLYNNSTVLQPDDPDVDAHDSVENSTLRVGDDIPDVANIASRKRVTYVPNRSMGPVEVRVRVW